jgi:hypothetical protein
MPLDTPAPLAPYARHGSNSGQPLTRRDGVLKVTGRATYAADGSPTSTSMPPRRTLAWSRSLHPLIAHRWLTIPT